MKRTAPHRTQAMHTAAASPVRDAERALLAAAAVAVGFAEVTSEAPNYSPTQYQPTTH